jgi:hypothetical protein
MKELFKFGISFFVIVIPSWIGISIHSKVKGDISFTADLLLCMFIAFFVAVFVTAPIGNKIIKKFKL